MTFYKILIALISFFTINATFANTACCVTFFASNNSKEINLQTAYARLAGAEQLDLQNSMIHILQKNHLQQGKFTNILGTYRMSRDKKITADNTAQFEASPFQHLSEQKVFSLAQALAIALKQDSVAVFIPNQNTVGEITIHFISRKPDVNELIKILHAKLPAIYNEAFSLHLANACGGFNHATVSEIEWLGSKINIKQVKKVFPAEKISFHYGKAFLIHNNGRQESL